MKWLAAAWVWLTKSRYTRSLELRVAQLEAELQRWQNAMLEAKGLPVLRSEDRAPLPTMKRRNLTPSQWRAKAEAMSSHPPEEKRPS